MKIRICDDKSKEIFFENRFIQTNVPVDISFSDGFKLYQTFQGKGVSIDILEQNVEPYEKSNKLNFISDIDYESGWGNVTVNLINRSVEEFNITAIGKVHSSVVDYGLIALTRKEIDSKALTVYHQQPRATWDKPSCERNIAIIPFETTLVPKSWVPRINAFTALLVPCKQNIQMFRDSGVTIPIELIWWGFESSKFYPIERHPNRPFTFGTMGRLSTRKGTDLLIRAFQDEFKTEKDVRLICKTSDIVYPFMAKDPRIVEKLGAWSHADIIKDFYQEVDCFVFPTRGEGWGLPVVEAMATGIPAICTNWSGPQEFMTKEDGYLLDYKLVPADDFTKNIYKEECGNWAEPDYNQLRNLLRHCYSHQEEVKSKGQLAAKRMFDKYTWEKVIPMFHSAIHKYQ